MRLIIEGVDKSGKSTLIETLKNRFPRAVQLKLMTKPFDNSQEETEKLFEIYTTMKEMTDKKEYIYIFDRYFQSELVYSYIRGNDRLKTKEGKEFFENLERDISEDTLVVLLEHPAKEVAKRFKKCKEDFVTPEQIETLQKRYREVVENSKLPYIILDTVEVGLSESVNIIKNKMFNIIL